MSDLNRFVVSLDTRLQIAPDVVERIKAHPDPKSRAVLYALELECRLWREFSRRTKEMAGTLNEMQRLYPNITMPALSLVSSGIANAALSIKSLCSIMSKHEMGGARERVNGFDARRKGVPLTANPHISVVPSLGDDDNGYYVDGYVVTVNHHLAKDWHIGWKQGARAGESHF